MKWARKDAPARGTEYFSTCRRRRGAANKRCCAQGRRGRRPWNADTCWAAAQGGQLEALQWARENGCPWDERTCRSAAYSGHLEALQWARENDCPWDENTCWAAAQGGHLEALKWARENGWPLPVGRGHVQ